MLLIVFACAAIWSKNKKVGLIKFILLTIVAFFVGLALISGMAIIRYGVANLGFGMGIVELSLWILHGDLVGALTFGAFVSDALSGSLLYGRYCLGEYLSIFIPNFSNHSAEFIRDGYMPDRQTAQSIGTPFNYYADFGAAGVAAFGLLVGGVYAALRKSFFGGTSVITLVAFPLFFYQLILGVRNGVFPLNPIFVYLLLSLNFIIFCEIL